MCQWWRMAWLIIHADVNTVVKKTAELTVEELKNRSAIIRNAVESGKLELRPAYYHLGSGKVEWL